MRVRGREKTNVENRKEDTKCLNNQRVIGVVDVCDGTSRHVPRAHTPEHFWCVHFFPLSLSLFLLQHKHNKTIKFPNTSLRGLCLIFIVSPPVDCYCWWWWWCVQITTKWFVFTFAKNIVITFKGSEINNKTHLICNEEDFWAREREKDKSTRRPQTDEFTLQEVRQDWHTDTNFVLFIAFTSSMSLFLFSLPFCCLSFHFLSVHTYHTIPTRLSRATTTTTATTMLTTK